MTIPKLELMGALLLAKLVSRISEELSPFVRIDVFVGLLDGFYGCSTLDL